MEKEEENYIREKQLANLPKAISLKLIKNLENISKTHICKIYCNDGSHGSGFFCNIQNNWNNNLKVLITNNHVLNKNDIKPGNLINISLDNDSKYYKILIDESRLTYTNESYDVTFIEIKEDDKLNENSFFELDKQIFKENANQIFKNSQVFLLHYPKGIEMEISPGVIKLISEDNKTIEHYCDTSGGSSGSPIINKDNFQVIGVHKGAANKNYNLGTLLKIPVEKFNEEIKMNKINKNDIKKNNIIEENKNNNLNFEKKNETNYKDKKEEKNKIMKNYSEKKNIEQNKDLKIESNNFDEITIEYDISYTKTINIFGETFAVFALFIFSYSFSTLFAI